MGGTGKSESRRCLPTRFGKAVFLSEAVWLVDMVFMMLLLFGKRLLLLLSSSFVSAKKPDSRTRLTPFRRRKSCTIFMKETRLGMVFVKSTLDDGGENAKSAWFLVEIGTAFTRNQNEVKVRLIQREKEGT